MNGKLRKFTYQGDVLNDLLGNVFWKELCTKLKLQRVLFLNILVNNLLAMGTRGNKKKLVSQIQRLLQTMDREDMRNADDDCGVRPCRRQAN